MIFRRFWLFLVTLILLFTSPVLAQEAGRVATLMFYNLENLYDTRDDTLHRDDEFRPEGERHWSNTRFYNKLTALAKVILNTGEWEPPVVLGFCEVENRWVLEQLVNHPLLKRWDYQIIHKDSPDKRGIDVAALYRPDLFTPLSYRYFPPVAGGEPIPGTREILYLCGIVGSPGETGEGTGTGQEGSRPSRGGSNSEEGNNLGSGGKRGDAAGDTLHLFFNHWPSRYGGLMETRPLRMKAARRLKSEVHALQQAYRHPFIIISGDFNDQPHDQSLVAGLGAQSKRCHHPDSLVNLSFAWQESGKGTLKYQSQWNIFDQFIVSEALLGSEGSLGAPGSGEPGRKTRKEGAPGAWRMKKNKGASSTLESADPAGLQESEDPAGIQESEEPEDTQEADCSSGIMESEDREGTPDAGGPSAQGKGLCVFPGDARILEAPFLLEEDEKFTGTRLRRTYLGFRYQGGFSDHLPVLLSLRRKNH